jgi:hypothetical protein
MVYLELKIREEVAQRDSDECKEGVVRVFD